jgi:hypothetical protein
MTGKGGLDPEQPGARVPSYILWAGVLALLAGLSALLFLLLRDQTPLLTPAELERARECWSRNVLPDYDIILRKEIDARPTEREKTEVRGGKASRLFVDDTPVSTRDSYSVEGLFDLMDRELEMASSPATQAGQPKGAILKATFQPEWGFPLLFKRLASRGRSVVITVEKVEVPGERTIFPSKE